MFQIGNQSPIHYRGFGFFAQSVVSHAVSEFFNEALRGEGAADPLRWRGPRRGDERNVQEEHNQFYPEADSSPRIYCGLRPLNCAPPNLKHKKM